MPWAGGVNPSMHWAGVFAQGVSVKGVSAKGSVCRGWCGTRGRHPLGPEADTPRGYYGIRSTSGRHALHWKSFLLEWAGILVSEPLVVLGETSVLILEVQIPDFWWYFHVTPFTFGLPQRSDDVTTWRTQISQTIAWRHFKTLQSIYSSMCGMIYSFLQTDIDSAWRG